MVPDGFYRSKNWNERTLAALASCRDNGWDRVAVGALCLSSWDCDSVGFHDMHCQATPPRTSTRPPPFPSSAPCPYRTGPRYYPIRLERFIRTEADGSLITPFDRQNS